MQARRVVSWLLASLLVSLATASGAQQTSIPDLTKLLSPPPAAGTQAARDDLKAVLQTQADRSADEAAAAEGDSERSVFRFANILGTGFQASSLPRTAAFFEHVAQLDKTSVKMAKSYWKRPRPSVVSNAVRPLAKEKSDDWSYPSGHATFGYSAAVLLADMLPEKREVIFLRAQDYARHRVVMGAHFPSDVQAGEIAGTVIAARILEDAVWRTDFEAACGEVREALGLSMDNHCSGNDSPIPGKLP